MLQLLIASSPALQAPARPALVRRAANGAAASVSMVASVEAPPVITKPLGVPMTGDTLQAALKMRCDNSGASYAIYWANQRGSIKAAAAYETAQLKSELKSRGMTESFDEASMAYVLSATGTGPVATVIATGEPVMIEEVSSSNLQRRCVPALLAHTHTRTHRRTQRHTHTHTHSEGTPEREPAAPLRGESRARPAAPPHPRTDTWPPVARAWGLVAPVLCTAARRTRGSSTGPASCGVPV